MLEDRPSPDDAPPEELEPPPSGSFNPLFAIGGAVTMLVVALLVGSGLLIPALVFLGVLGGYILIQVVIFKVFPPRKS